MMNTVKRVLVPAGLALGMATLVTACNCTRSTQAQTTPQAVNEPSGAPAPAPMTEQQAANIPLYSETLQVGKQSVDAGQVRLRKVIVTEQTSQPVELRHESLQITREPAGAMSSSQEANAFQPQDIVIRLHEEQPVLSKQIVQTGTIVANKNATMEQRTVTGDVRKEDVQVVKSGSSVPVTFPGGQINEAAGAQSWQATPQEQQQQQQQQQMEPKEQKEQTPDQSK